MTSWNGGRTVPPDRASGPSATRCTEPYESKAHVRQDSPDRQPARPLKPPSRRKPLTKRTCALWRQFCKPGGATKRFGLD